MNAERLRQTIALYKQKYEQWDKEVEVVPKERWEGDSTCYGRFLLAHCRWMLDEMEKFIDQGDIDRTVRWLCFIQGAVGHHFDFTIKDFRSQITAVLQ